MPDQDDARIVAFDPAAPADERFDAQVEMTRSMTSAPSRDDLAMGGQIVAALREVAAMGSDLFSKGALVPFPGRGKPIPKRGPLAIQVDDLKVSSLGDYYEPMGGLGFDTMRRMVDQTPILSAIVLTRIRQVQRFCGISEDGGPGFDIVHRDREHQPTEGEKEKMRELRRFFENCGWEARPRLRKRLKRDSFSGYMAKLVRETLTYDACPVETEMKRDRAQGVDGFYAVDGSTIRLCDEEGYDGDDSLFAVQVIDGRVTAAFSYDQLVYEVRNPRADVTVAGYGMGEPELLVRIATGFLNAMAYNISGFDKNSIPKGLLNLVGEYPDAEMAAFKRYLQMMVQGAENRFALPVLSSKNQDGKATFVPFGVEFNEMHFPRWMTFLTSIAAAIYGMAPDEINFESFAVSKSSLSGDDTTEKLADSKDKGLHSVLSFIEGMHTDYFLPEGTGADFMFRFTGLTPKDQAREWEAKKLVMTTDELRAQLNLGKHPDKVLGEAPLNPSLIGPWTQMRQQAERPEGQDFGGGQPGGDFGQEDDEPGDDDGGDGRAQEDAGEREEGPETGAARAGGDFGKALAVYRIEPL